MSTRFFDGKFIAEIDMRIWTGSQYLPDLSNDFFNVGSLEYNHALNAYCVPDVFYCIGQAGDWESFMGDYHNDTEKPGFKRIAWTDWTKWTEKTATNYRWF